MKTFIFCFIVLCASFVQAQCPNCQPQPQPQQQFNQYNYWQQQQPKMYQVRPGLVPTIVAAPLNFLFAPRLVPVRQQYMIVPVR